MRPPTKHSQKPFIQQLASRSSRSVSRLIILYIPTNQSRVDDIPENVYEERLYRRGGGRILGLGKGGVGLSVLKGVVHNGQRRAAGRCMRPEIYYSRWAQVEGNEIVTSERNAVAWQKMNTAGRRNMRKQLPVSESEVVSSTTHPSFPYLSLTWVYIRLSRASRCLFP